MTVYYCGWAITLISQIIVLGFKGVNRRRVQNITLVVIIAYFFIISAFRAENIGTDLSNYLYRYPIIGKTAWGQLSTLNARWGFEYGFLIFCKILYSIFPNPRFFIIFTSAFIIGSVSRVIIKYSRLPNLSFYLFSLFAFLETSFNLVRLFIALGICLFSIEAMIQKKPLKFLIIVIIASLFHTTALCFIVVYLLYHYFKLNDRNLIIFAVVCVIVRVAAVPLLNLILGLFGLYYNSYSDAIGSGSGFGMLILLLFIFIFYYVEFVRGKGSTSLITPEKSEMNGVDLLNQSEEDKITSNSLNNLWLVAILTSILFNMLAFELEVAARIMWFTKIGLIFLIPNTIDTLAIKATKKDGSGAKVLNAIFIAGSCLLPIVLYYIRLMATDNAGVVPYTFGGF